MSGDVVDVNVLRTANGQADHVGIDCQLAAIDYLLDLREREALVLDDLYMIMNLYGAGCSHSGQPGVGDQFFVWARDNIALIERASFEIDDNGNFSTFPTVSPLRSFDWDDRVYVATALATEPPSRLVNAIDSDYSEHEEAFRECGLVVAELCPDSLHSGAKRRGANGHSE